MIIVRLYGGMGNQMFQYALGRMLAIKNNTRLKLDLTILLDRGPHGPNYVFRDYDLDIFTIEAELARRREIPLRYRSYFPGRIRAVLGENPGAEKSFVFDPDVLLLGPDAFLEGYWQSPKYFENIANVIRRDFTLRSPLSEKSQKLKSEIRSCSSLCINVRRGDFVTSDVHGTFGDDYYAQGIARIQQQRKIDKVFVFSDDVPWCEEHLRFALPAMFVGHDYAGQKFGEYLLLMSACKHFVIPNSSFGWWAAWLNTESEKIVIAPRRWFLDQSINTKDLTPSNWERI